MTNKLSWVILLLLLLPTCRKDNCPGTFHELHISMGNRADHDLDVKLYPNSRYAVGNDYIPGTFGSGYKESAFSIEASGAITWFNSELLFYTHDTLIDPSRLLRQVFDSISISVKDSMATRILFTHDSVSHYLVNPFTDSLLWTFQVVFTSRPDNDCENPSRIKDFTFPLEQVLISPEAGK